MDDDNLSLGLSRVGKSTSGVSDLGDGVTPVSCTLFRESNVPGNRQL